MDKYIDIVAIHLYQAIRVTFMQVAAMMGPALALALLMNAVSSATERYSFKIMGSKLYLGLFGWLGTVVHELGHAAMCVLFRHRILEMKLFDPDPAMGTLGYVRHSYDRKSLYQNVGNFFIGVGPVIFGGLAIFIAAKYLASADILADLSRIKLNSGMFWSAPSAQQLLSNLDHWMVSFLGTLFARDNLTSWRFYVFMYLVFCIGGSIRLSAADVKGAAKGALFFLGLIFAANFVALLFGGMPDAYIAAAARAFTFFYTIMIFAIAMNLIFLAPLFILNYLKRRSAPPRAHGSRRRSYK